MRRPPSAGLLACGAALLLLGCEEKPSESFLVSDQPSRVVALGRIEPDELVRVAGPARIAAVVDELLVAEGDEVEAGQLIALLDSVGVEEAEVSARRAELEDAERSLGRARNLSRQRVAAQADTDAARAQRDLAASHLRQAEAELERSRVRSPIAGRVLDVHTRAGEKVGPEGIVEIADRSPMLAVAEVWESDVPKVRIGQVALVRSPALADGELRGVVRKIASRIGRRDVLESDPVAAVDARVVEVEIELLESEAVKNLIHLQVEVELLAELADLPPPPPPAPTPPPSTPSAEPAADG